MQVFNIYEMSFVEMCFKEVSYAYQGYIYCYSIKITLKTVIL